MYKGITLIYDPSPPSSVHTFTLVLKTALSDRTQPPNVPPSPEPATLSYEANFAITPTSLDSPNANDGTRTVNLKLNDFVPTYRGKKVERSDPRYQPLHSEKIYELSLMCRSGFGQQKGDFEVNILSISKWKKDRGVLQGVLMWLSSGWRWMTSWLASFARGSGHVRLDEKEGFDAA